jgi:hypothetical protein
MQDKTSTKETMKDKANQMSAMAEQAVKNCEQTLRSGLKFQQEAGQWWATMLDQSASAETWQKRFTSFANLANGLKPAAQKRMEEVMELAEKNTRTGTELFKKAAEAVQTPAIAESQAKWMDFWTSSLGAVRSSAEPLTQVNGRAMDTWIEFVQKNAEIAQGRGSKAA